jgi:hypothetical protein
MAQQCGRELRGYRGHNVGAHGMGVAAIVAGRVASEDRVWRFVGIVTGLRPSRRF